MDFTWLSLPNSQLLTRNILVNCMMQEEPIAPNLLFRCKAFSLQSSVLLGIFEASVFQIEPTASKLFHH